MRAYGRFAAAGPRRARVGAVPAVIAGTQGQRVLAGGWGASGINVVDLSAAYLSILSEMEQSSMRPRCCHIIACIVSFD
jgi:hypothetical protein